MRIAVSGPTGLVGSEVVASLSAVGHEVVRLVRRAPAPAEKAVRWDPGKGEGDAAGGAGGSGPPFPAPPRAALPRPPRSLVCASASSTPCGRGADKVAAESPPGAGF